MTKRRFEYPTRKVNQQTCIRNRATKRAGALTRAKLNIIDSKNYKQAWTQKFSNICDSESSWERYKLPRDKQ